MSVGRRVWAAFDGPSRAVGCADKIRKLAGNRGVPIRASLHIGECELHGTELRGTAMAITASLVEHADPGEILVSRTVKDLIAGSGHRFVERGTVPLTDAAESLSLYVLAS